MNECRTMQKRVEQYVSARRKLGYQMRVQGRELLRFARFADELGHRGPLSTEIALRWAREAQGCSSLHQARRLEDVRCLARHLSALEPGTEIPPKGLLGAAHRRTQPHIYAPKEITALIKASVRVPEIMATLIPETLACLKEGQNGRTIACRASEYRIAGSAEDG
jgi:hypothetical protein